MYNAQKRSGGGGASRVQRTFQILSRLYDERFIGQDPGCLNTGELEGWLSTGQLAREIALKPSPHLRGLLDEMLGKGLIEVHSRAWRKNMPVYYWRISEATRHNPGWSAAFDAYLGEGEKDHA